MKLMSPSKIIKWKKKHKTFCLPAVSQHGRDKNKEMIKL